MTLEGQAESQSEKGLKSYIHFYLYPVSRKSGDPSDRERSLNPRRLESKVLVFAQHGQYRTLPRLDR
jgi:hypothetical protein